MKFSVFQLSRQGGREKNEDRMGYCYTRDASLFMLADGMGGHPDGEAAAQIALQTLSSLFQKHAKPYIEDERFFLKSGLLVAHRQIVRYASARAMLDSPRTTIVAGLIQRGQMHWVHCGDSRLYVVRRGELLTRTRDHSYLDGKGLSNYLRKRMNRNVLFTCLGSNVQPIFDTGGPLRLEEGDKIMLCSDGLWGNLDEAHLVDVLHGLPVSQSVPELVEEALRKGGRYADNATALALEWERPARPEDDTGFTHTGDLSDLGFASTIQADELETLRDDMNEQEIERSLAEINEAIERMGARRSGT